MTDQKPIPSPQTPVSGLAKHDAEMRRRIIAEILPHSQGAITTTEELLEVAAWVEHGDEGDE